MSLTQLIGGSKKKKKQPSYSKGYYCKMHWLQAQERAIFKTLNEVNIPTGQTETSLLFILELFGSGHRHHHWTAIYVSGNQTTTTKKKKPKSCFERCHLGKIKFLLTGSTRHRFLFWFRQTNSFRLVTIITKATCRRPTMGGIVIWANVKT